MTATFRDVYAHEAECVECMAGRDCPTYERMLEEAEVAFDERHASGDHLAPIS